jgi:hypothetical protein
LHAERQGYLSRLAGFVQKPGPETTLEAGICRSLINQHVRQVVFIHDQGNGIAAAPACLVRPEIGRERPA